MDSSKFNLWRAAMAFTMVDKTLASQEQEWIKSKFEILKFTKEQTDILLNDAKNPPELESLLPLITKPSDRAFLIDQMRHLSKIDGHLAPSEKEKIEKLKEIVLSKINLPELENLIAADEKASYHEDEVYKVNNPGSIFESIIRSIQKTANPGDYKMPKK